ncbi:hypothetical protein CEXT_535991 [Caerostris extrusa]|uniref:Uncharacterized protein n=1 Tax=Caerostris extrusa TaxID=172846 RepID=A0AAV4QMF0_CAEEX|nr:hypothetical protein CEXT_535991 [Caerostris extrusa]
MLNYITLVLHRESVPFSSFHGKRVHGTWMIMHVLTRELEYPRYLKTKYLASIFSVLTSDRAYPNILEDVLITTHELSIALSRSFALKGFVFSIQYLP